MGKSERLEGDRHLVESLRTIPESRADWKKATDWEWDADTMAMIRAAQASWNKPVVWRTRAGQAFSLLARASPLAGALTGRYYFLTSIGLGLGYVAFGALYGVILLALGIAPTPTVLAVAKRNLVSLALIVPFFETLIFAIVWYATWPLPSRYLASFYFLSMVVLGILGFIGNGV